ncbi:MAG: chromosome segregation protein SMC [Candidatus Tectomicrobia bacterium]|nr:chromosome segregation protein SMC [Candidatus Tectomicrobia bacterium]
MQSIYIKEIELDNFKSFKKKIVIPFHPGFTTISGPNGSGKSNILDGILFALGLSTSKSLRAERLPDLINNSNGRHEAQVTVRLGIVNRKNGGDLSSTNLEISRQIKVGKSTYHSLYMVNGKIVSLSEVHEKLAELNISLEGSNIVMQGDVTSIIAMSPTERRKVIDDLAGVAEFDRRIEAAHEELLQADRYIEQSAIILEEIAHMLKRLTDEKDQALTYQKLRDRKEELETTLLLAKLSESQKGERELQRQIEGLQRKKGRFTADLAKAKEELRELQKSLTDEYRQKLEEAEDRRISLLQALEGIKGKKVGEGSWLERLYTQLKREEATLSETQLKIEKGTERLSQLLLEIEKIKEEREKAEQVVFRYTYDLKSIQEEMDRVNQEYAGLSQSYFETKSDVAARKAERESLEARQKMLSASTDEIQSELASTARQERILLDQIKGLRNREGELKTLRSRQESQLQEVISLIEKVKEELEGAKSDLEASEISLKKLYRDFTDLEAKRRAFSESDLGEAVQVVLASGIEGIHGTVAQLAEFPQEFEVALEIAAGARLRHIVVENERVGIKIIDHLKRKGAGRVTLLPLNKINAQLTLKRLSIEGVIDYAINLIRYELLYKSIFTYVFSDTLIIKDLEVGRPLIGKYRMVTLDGDLLEKSGAMTGGSIPKSFGALSLARIRELRALYEKGERKVADQKRLVQKKEEELSKLRLESSTLEKGIAQASLESDHLASQIQSNEGQISGLKQKAASLRNKLGSLIREENALARKGEETEASLEPLEAKLKELEEILAKSPLSALSERVALLDRQKEEAEQSLRSLADQYNRKELERSLRANEVGESKRQAIELQRAIERLKGEVAAHQEIIVHLEEEQVRLESQLEASLAEVTLLKGEGAGLQEKLRELSKAETDLIWQIDRADSQIDLAEEKLQGVREEIEKLREGLSQHPRFQSSLPLERKPQEIEGEIRQIEGEMLKLEPVNMRAIKEYDETFNRSVELKKKIETLLQEKGMIVERIEEYGSRKRQVFLETFEKVNEEFQKVYSELSGGYGKLTLDDPENPFDGGLSIKAQPAYKKMERLEALSGGEKSLAALAFLFALQTVLPSSFYILDEVDMFLDGYNTQALSKMIRRQSQETQFIVISLRRSMIESSHRTVGVTQTKGGETQVTGISMSL